MEYSMFSNVRIVCACKCTINGTSRAVCYSNCSVNKARQAKPVFIENPTSCVNTTNMFRVFVCAAIIQRRRFLDISVGNIIRFHTIHRAKNASTMSFNNAYGVLCTHPEKCALSQWMRWTSKRSIPIMLTSVYMNTWIMLSLVSDAGWRRYHKHANE